MNPVRAQLSDSGSAAIQLIISFGPGRSKIIFRNFSSLLLRPQGHSSFPFGRWREAVIFLEKKKKQTHIDVLLSLVSLCAH